MRINYPQIYEGWSDYELKKIEKGEDAAYFSCNEAWEFFYLEKKIHTSLPHINRIVILEIIESCCRSKTQPVERSTFIDNVMRKLMIVEKIS